MARDWKSQADSTKAPQGLTECAPSGCGRFVLSGGEFHSLRLMAQIGEDRIYLSVAAAVQDFEQRNQEENK